MCARVGSGSLDRPGARSSLGLLMPAQKGFEVLAVHHDRRIFSCDVAELDRYFQQQVTQDIRRRITSRFLAIAADDAIAGYYTLASGSIPIRELPDDLAKRLPRYPSLPAVRIGRCCGMRRRARCVRSKQTSLC